MGSRATLARGRRAISIYGVRGTARLAAGKLNHLRRQPPDTFDAEHGTDTARIVRLEGLDSVSDEQARVCHRYQACDVTRTTNTLRNLLIRYEDFTFIDVGSGKGRALFVAAEFPFRRVIGVEFAQELHQIALENLYVTGRGEIEAVWADATEYDWPVEPLVLYFNNPFLAPVMRTVLRRVADSIEQTPRPVWLIIFAPEDVQREALEAGFRPELGECVYAWPG